MAGGDSMPRARWQSGGAWLWAWFSASARILSVRDSFQVE